MLPAIVVQLLEFRSPQIIMLCRIVFSVWLAYDMIPVIGTIRPKKSFLHFQGTPFGLLVRTDPTIQYDIFHLCNRYTPYFPLRLATLQADTNSPSTL